MSASAKRERTPSFVCELPLRAEPAAIHALNSRLEASRQVYNACLGEALRRARLLLERRAYRKARRLPKGGERTAAFRAARRSVEFTDAALQRYAVRLRQRAFKEPLDVHVAQKLGSRAFAAANAWLLGERGRPRFKGYRQLDTVEGKSNHAGIRWREGAVEWKGLLLPAIIDPRDPMIPPTRTQSRWTPAWWTAACLRPTGAGWCRFCGTCPATGRRRCGLSGGRRWLSREEVPCRR